MKLLGKKLLICIGVFCLFTTSVCFADNYKMVSEKKDADGNREVAYDNGKISTFNYDETYVISEVDEGDFTIDTYNDGSVTKIYTWQLKEMERLRKDKKFLSIGFNTKKNNDGTKTVTRIRYSETKEWIDVPNGELILQQNDSTPYQCHLYLAKKFFPNDDIYTKRMEYNEHAQAEKERLQAQYAEAKEAAEERRQEQQAKQEMRKEALENTVNLKKEFKEKYIEIGRKYKVDSSIESDNNIKSYIDLYNDVSVHPNDPSDKMLGKIIRAGYTRISCNGHYFIIKDEDYYSFIDEVYVEGKNTIDELLETNTGDIASLKKNVNSKVNEIVNLCGTGGKGWSTKINEFKKYNKTKETELKNYAKELTKNLK